MLKSSVAWTRFGYPPISAGWLRESTITVARSVKDLNEDTLRLTTDVLEVESESNELRRKVGMLCGDLAKPVAMDISPTGAYTLMLRNGGKDGTKPTCDLNSGSSSVRIDCSESHGKVLGDSGFSSIAWSRDEQFVAYVALKMATVKVPTSLFAAEGGDKGTRGTKFEHVDDWGEKYEGVGDTCISVLNTRTGVTVAVPGLDAEGMLTVGQPLLRQDASSGKTYLIYTAWRNKPKRLGLVFCYQRPSSLFAVDISKLLEERNDEGAASTVTAVTPIELTGGSCAVARSPRLSPDGTTLVFIGRTQPLATHNGCFQLLSLNMDGAEAAMWAASCKVCVDIVDTPQHSPELAFPGLFLDQLPRQCFVSNKQVALSSMWGSRESVLLVDLDSAPGSTPQRLGLAPLVLDNRVGEADAEAEEERWNDLSDASCSLLDVCAESGRLLFAASAPNLSPRVGLYEVATQKLWPDTAAPAPSVVHMGTGERYCDATARVRQVLTGMRWRVMKHRADSGEGGYFESILLLPSRAPGADGKLPLIVVPHGGPHSAFSTSFLASSAFLASECNAAVLSVNYRGSTGFGQSSVDSLPGNIGTNDVADMLTAINDALKASCPIPLDRANMAVVGGSHGGFLTAHLIGQHPDLFRAAALRNPVTNIPAMFGVTDIPDWCAIETGVEYDFTKYSPNTPEGLSAMFQASPIRYIDSVRTPSLLCLGSKDKRVPPSQGLDYFHHLQARGIPSQLLVFPEDNHSLDRPCTEAEHFVAIAQWFQKFLLST